MGGVGGGGSNGDGEDGEVGGGGGGVGSGGVGSGILCVIGSWLVYFVMASTNRVFGILLIALRLRFPAASIASLSSLNGVQGTMRHN